MCENNDVGVKWLEQFLVYDNLRSQRMMVIARFLLMVNDRLRKADRLSWNEEGIIYVIDVTFYCSSFRDHHRCRTFRLWVFFFVYFLFLVVVYVCSLLQFSHLIRFKKMIKALLQPNLLNVMEVLNVFVSFITPWSYGVYIVTLSYSSDLYLGICLS